MWLNWSFLFSTQQWAHLIIFFVPLIQMDLWISYSSWLWPPEPQQILLVALVAVVLPKDWPSASQEQRHICRDPFSNSQLVVIFFIFTVDSFHVLQHLSPSCSMVTYLSMWLLFSLKNSLLSHMFSRKDGCYIAPFWHIFSIPNVERYCSQRQQ